MPEIQERAANLGASVTKTDDPRSRCLPWMTAVGHANPSHLAWHLIAHPSKLRNAE